MRHLLIATAVTALTLTPAAKALGQQDMGNQSAAEARARGVLETMINRRARLGLTMTTTSRDTDSLGAFVEAVTPGGPADRAGIRSGDIISKLNGKVLGISPSDAERELLPVILVGRVLSRLEPNDTIPVEIRRGQQRKTVSVTTTPEADGVSMSIHLDVSPAALALLSSPLADLETAPLNPDLGQYFGVTEGVLVISCPKGAGLGLKGGDVIQAVDGRKPSDPAHLMRIMHSYGNGEALKLDVLRNRKHIPVTIRWNKSDSGEASQKRPNR